MNDSATFRRTAAVVGLIGAVLASAAWSLLEPPFPPDYVDRLAVIDEGGASATASAVLFALSQLFMLAAVLGIAHLIRHRAPVLSNLGATMSVIGVLGHAVLSGSMLITVGMARDAENRELYAGLIEDFESSPMMLFAAAGLLGTVLGLLLLSIGLFRARVVPRWIPALLWAFLVIEFVGTALSDFATYAALLSLAIAFGALARHIQQMPRSDWELATSPAGEPRVSVSG